MTLKKNDELKLEIISTSVEGHGIGKHEGMCIFVPGSAVGDVINVLIVKVTKKFAFGKIISFAKKSINRIDVDCEVFNQCGGCVYRHINYEEECRIKWQRVADAVKRIGHIDVVPEEIVSADHENFYRNKAQLPVCKNGDDVKIGFYAVHSHRIINTNCCNLQPEIFNDIVACCREWVSKFNIECYNETTNSGLLRHVYIRQAPATDEIMVCFVINGNFLPYNSEIVELLSEKFPNIKSILININKEKTNVILGKKYKTLFGQAFITDMLCGCKFKISPQSFYQVNHDQAEKLYNLGKEFADLKPTDVLLDLYCGTGTIGLTMAKDVKKLVGIEVVEKAIEDAKENALLNSIKNAEFICGDAGTALNGLNIKPNVVVLDPPRKGCDLNLIETVCKIAPEKIVYISCDPATLARDLALFKDRNYKTVKITPVDLFPRTAHVETVVLMSRIEK